MSSYPTTLLPPSPPYRCVDHLVGVICQRCIEEQEDDNVPDHIKQQLFELTLTLVEFWYQELKPIRINDGPQ